MQRIIDYARGRGIREIFGEVLRENKRMLKVCDQFEFSRTTNPDDQSIVRLSFFIRKIRMS
jgi:acetyltransferase